jgi:hypothetical protein
MAQILDTFEFMVGYVLNGNYVDDYFTRFSSAAEQAKALREVGIIATVRRIPAFDDQEAA